MKRALMVATLVAVFATAALAQGKGKPAEAPKQVEPKQQTTMVRNQTQRMEQMQVTAKQMDQLMNRMREHNALMEKQQARREFRDIGQHMEQAGERLQMMLKAMDGVCRDPEVQRDRDRLRDMDRLHEQLKTMTRQMEQAHEMLRGMTRG